MTINQKQHDKKEMHMHVPKPSSIQRWDASKYCLCRMYVRIC